jgi:protein gp37
MPKTKSSKYWDVPWNPITGCTKFSEGCQNCYAEIMHNRWRAAGVKKYQHSFDKPNFHPEELEKIPRGKGKIVFVCNMSDLFNEQINGQAIEDILNVMSENWIHKYVICTKRTERMSEMVIASFAFPLDNCIFMTTIENQEMYEKRMPHLCELKEENHLVGVSFEPLLGEIKLDDQAKRLDWVIVGGETGKNARFLNEDWLYKISTYCQKFDIPFFFKKSGDFFSGFSKEWIIKDKNGNYIRQYPKGWKR